MAIKSTKWQIFLIFMLYLILWVLFAIFVRYGKESSDISKDFSERYPLFQDVHVMIFVGFGFLMTFLKRYGYSAVSFNLLVGSFLIQWAIICNGFYKMKPDNIIYIGIETLMEADVAVAAVLISMGAVLGKTSYLQLIIMGVIEVALYASNKYLCTTIFKAVDAGESIFTHVFGAYFGIAVSFAMRRKPGAPVSDNDFEGSSYISDLFSMIGTVFLWMYWPSFNGGGVSGDEQHRAIVNTYLSLGACTVATFLVSALVHPERRFAMEHIQNATLAGGVAVGSVANLMVQPSGALLIGASAGVLSVLGFHLIQPRLNTRLRIHDTCGVNNLHGMPGLFAGVLSAVMAFLANEATYGTKLYEIWPARAYSSIKIQERTAQQQGMYQLIALGVTFTIACGTGFVTGKVVNSTLFGSIGSRNAFSDSQFFVVPDDDHVELIRPVTNVYQQNNSVFTIDQYNFD